MRPQFRAKSQGRYGKRHKPGEMDKTEEAYAALLQAMKLAGDIAEWRFESVTFKLAEGSRYTPDFEIVHNDGLIEYVDVKAGAIDEKSKTKIKQAREIWYMFDFTMLLKQSKKTGGGWSEVPMVGNDAPRESEVAPTPAKRNPQGAVSNDEARALLKKLS